MIKGGGKGRRKKRGQDEAEIIEQPKQSEQPEQAQAETVANGWKNRGCNVDVRAFRERIFWEDFSSDFPHQFAETSIAWMDRTRVVAAGAR